MYTLYTYDGRYDIKYSLEDIYLSICGEMAEEARVPGVKNAFSPGSLCEKQYQNLRLAYDRLLLRLGERDEDKDVEDIIGCMLSVQQELCCRMFRLGVYFGTAYNTGFRPDGNSP